MKNIILSTVLVSVAILFLAQSSIGQTICYPNGITFSTQADVDLFPVVNPGCSVIGGDVSISSSVTGLDSLYNVRIIDGSLSGSFNGVSNLEGLNNLDSIFGNLNINATSSGFTFEGLDNLTFVGDTSMYGISHHFIGGQFTDFTGLSSIKTIEGIIELFNCNNLESLDGLQTLENVEELNIMDCPNLESFNGLQGLTSIISIYGFGLIDLTSLMGLENLISAGTISLNEVSDLTDISALTNLQTIGTISIRDAKITNIDALENLTANSTIRLNNCDNLTDISAFETIDISSLNSLSLIGNDNLSVCNNTAICTYLDNDGNATINNNDLGCNGINDVIFSCCQANTEWCPESLTVCYPNGIIFSTQAEVDLFPVINPGCSVIGGNVSIGSSITGLDSLYNVRIIDGSLSGSFNGVSNLEGLNNLDSIFGNLNINTTSSGFTFEGLDNLTFVGDTSMYGISHHFIGGQFTDFTGLSSIKTIEGIIELFNCNNLESLDGLQTLENVEELNIMDCPNLESFNGLQGLTSIISIYGFGLIDLTSLMGLENLISAGTISLNEVSDLTDISALTNLQTIGTISIRDAKITNIDALENLTANSTIRLNNCDNLTDISAFETIDISSLNSLSLIGNDNLSVCNNTAICTYLDNDGNATINNNDLGCNGINDVIFSCCQANTEWCPESLTVCYPNGITFSTQAEVDLFPVINPGCSVIGGNVSIGSSITGLDSLYNVRIIDGSLSGSFNGVSNLEGLNNLDSIFGNLNINTTSSGFTFEGLDNLTFVGDTSMYGISHHFIGGQFTDFTGLSSIKTIEGIIELFNCNNLESLDGLQTLENVDELNIMDCPNLESFNGLQGLTSIISIYGFGLIDLTSLMGLENLISAGTISLNEASDLTDISALDNLQTIGTISIRDAKITDIGSLADLTVTTTIRLNNCDDLTDISAFETIDISSLNSLSLIGNDNLSVCNNTAICTYLDNDGNATINNNDIGCNGIIEVEYDCLDLLSIFIIQSITSFSGSSSNNNFWHNPSNWRNNKVPTSESYVIIPNTFDCVIQTDSTANCELLDVYPGGSISIEDAAELKVVGQ